MIENYRSGPAVNQWPGVSVFDATDAQCASLGAGRLWFDGRNVSSVGRSGFDVAIVAIALHRDSARFPNRML